jgi:hypothetical protein
MKVLGRWSLASVLKVVVDVPYFALLVILPLVGILTLWAVLSARTGGHSDKFQIQIPVRFELEEARHPFSSAHPEVRRVAIANAHGDLTVDGASSLGVAWAGLGFAIVGLTSTLFILGLLRAIFRTLRDQNPFVARNAVRIRTVGIVLILGQLAFGALAAWLTARVTRQVAIAGVSFDERVSFNGWVVFSGVILILLAEVFRLGAEMKGDLETARKIQFDLVPGEAFRRSDVVIQARMRPARSVGGDLYDIIDLDERRLAVVLGDVTGKGLPAALLMTSVVGSLRALLSAGLRGGELIAALNRHVCANSPSGRFLTLFYGELDATTGSLTYVNAGHNPPLLRRAGGGVDELEPTAMMLGVSADAPVEARQIEMQPADRLLLFSDGLSEALNAQDQEYGDTRVRESLQRAHELAPAAAVERLVADVERFRGSAPPHDDMTLMLIARQPA